RAATAKRRASSRRCNWRVLRPPPRIFRTDLQTHRGDPVTIIVESNPFESLAALPDVHIPLTLTVLSPISHGAGTSGNTQLLRTREVVGPDGSRASVPSVSGNSLRQTLGAALAWHLVRALEVEDGSLAMRSGDLLWAGGALTATGNQAVLDMMRRVHELMAVLGLL